MATYQLTGSVINTTTRHVIPALRIEVWGKPVKANKKLATATTAAEGGFVIQFDLQASKQNPGPMGFIKVFSGTTLLLTTAKQPIKLWTAEAKPLTIEVDQASDNMLQLFLTLGFSNGQPGAGVQLVFSYALPSGETWTSQPLIANAQGKLSFGVPIGIGTVIDWSRAGYKFSKAGKPLQIAEKSPPEQVSGGFALAIKLTPEKIPWPPEQDPNKWHVRGRESTPYGEAVIANVSAAAISLQGEKPIGQVQTGDTGRYEIIYKWDGKCPPDIQVSATVKDKLLRNRPSLLPWASRFESTCFRVTSPISDRPNLKVSSEVVTIVQQYRDRADCENNFDEIKNQWGWGGFVPQKIKPCRFIARIIALIYNWWSLFVRLAEPDKHYEAIVSRPLLLHGVGKQTSHAAQKTLTITSTHGRASYVRAAYERVCAFFDELKAIAPQLTPLQCWYRILSEAMKKYLKGALLKPPDLVGCDC